MQDDEVMNIVKAMGSINSLYHIDFMSYTINSELAMELKTQLIKTL